MYSNRTVYLNIKYPYLINKMCMQTNYGILSCKFTSVIRTFNLSHAFISANKLTIFSGMHILVVYAGHKTGKLGVILSYRRLK